MSIRLHAYIDLLAWWGYILLDIHIHFGSLCKPGIRNNMSCKVVHSNLFLIRA